MEKYQVTQNKHFEILLGFYSNSVLSVMAVKLFQAAVLKTENDVWFCKYIYILFIHVYMLMNGPAQIPVGDSVTVWPYSGFNS